MLSKEELINKLKLQPHPEGGFFKETYRSTKVLSADELQPEINGERNVSTCIYFLLTSENFSAFHRIKQDEIWHHYQGAVIKLHMISENGDYSSVIIGQDLFNNQTPQYVVQARTWFAAEILIPNSFALVGCTVAPGFNFDDFDLPSRQSLITKFPKHHTIIERLTNA